MTFKFRVLAPSAARGVGNGAGRLRLPGQGLSGVPRGAGDAGV